MSEHISKKQKESTHKTAHLKVPQNITPYIETNWDERQHVDSSSINANNLKPNMILQLQRTIGNQAVLRLLRNRFTTSQNQIMQTKSASDTLDNQNSDVVQRQDVDEDGTMTFAPMLIANEEFNKKAKRLNKVYAAKLSDDGWPYLPNLIQLWKSGDYEGFAEAVWNFQVNDLGISPESEGADGILGPKTATGMQSTTTSSDTTDQKPVGESTPTPEETTAPPENKTTPTPEETTTPPENKISAPVNETDDTDNDSGVANKISELKDASSGDRTAKAKELVNYVREQLTSYPALIDEFKSQSGLSDEQKVKIIGEISAAVGRMEFLVGSIFHEGSDKRWEKRVGKVDDEGNPVLYESGKYKGKQKKEWNNRGFMVDHYTHLKNKKDKDESTGPWCTRFATKVRSMVSGGKVVGSGYKVGTRDEFDYSSRGGAFVGASKARNASSSENSSSYNPWADLRERLKNAEGSKQEILQSFLEETGMTPQAGDVLVVRRSSGAKENSFTTKGSMSSHTALVESFDGTILYTIEGNKGQRVTGDTYDLTDEGAVEEIVHLSRPGLDSDTTVSKASKEAAEESGISGGITRDALLEPVNEINKLLQEYAAEAGYINELSDTDVDAVANMTKAGGSNSDT